MSAWRVPKGNAVLRPDFYCSNPGAVWSIGFGRVGGDIGGSADRDFPDLIARQRTRPCSSYFTRAGGGCPESCGLAHIPRIFLQFFSPLDIDKCCFVKCDCCTPTGTVIGISSTMRERPSSLFLKKYNRVTKIVPYLNVYIETFKPCFQLNFLQVQEYK